MFMGALRLEMCKTNGDDGSAANDGFLIWWFYENFNGLNKKLVQWFMKLNTAVVELCTCLR